MENNSGDQLGSQVNRLRRETAERGGGGGRRWRRGRVRWGNEKGTYSLFF